MFKKYWETRKQKKEEKAKIKQAESTSKKIIKGVIEWLIYLIIFGLIVWGTPKSLSYFLHTDYPIASITSSSMWPALKQGDIVLIKGASAKEDIKKGDIVVFRNVRGFTIHRVVRLYDDQFITRGDANNVDDKPVSYSELVGKALTIKGKPFRIPYLGKISQMYLLKQQEKSEN